MVCVLSEACVQQKSAGMEEHGQAAPGTIGGLVVAEEVPQHKEHSHVKNGADRSDDQPAC